MHSCNRACVQSCEHVCACACVLALAHALCVFVCGLVEVCGAISLGLSWIAVVRMSVTRHVRSGTRTSWDSTLRTMEARRTCGA